MPRRVIVFDVNETLLDMAALDAPFKETFGSADAKGRWFAQLLSLAMTSVITGAYHDFSAGTRAGYRWTDLGGCGGQNPASLAMEEAQSTVSLFSTRQLPGYGLLLSSRAR